jgi:hypothetical protein
MGPGNRLMATRLENQVKIFEHFMLLPKKPKIESVKSV